MRWYRKSMQDLKEEILPEEHPHKLKRVLRAWDLILLGIGAVIGAGLFSLTGIAAAENAGPAIILAFVIAAMGCCFAGLCYSELSSMIPVAGSAYTYAYATMGEIVAWFMGWTLVLEYAIGAATVSISWSAYAVSLLQGVGINLPPYLVASPWQSIRLADGSQAYGLINLPAFLIVALISLVLIRGIRQSSIVNAIVVMVKVVAVLVFIAFGLFYITADNYTPFIPENTGHFGHFGWSGILRAAGVLFFAYIGFDAVSTAAQETINPQKNVPLGIMGSLAICTILYIAFGFVLTGLVSYKDLHVAAPVAVATSKIPFPWISGLINLAVLSGLTSVVLVMLLGQSRIFYAMARDKLLPNFFSDIHPRFHTPWRSNLILMVFVGSIGAFAPIAAVGQMTSIGTLLAFTVVCAGVPILRYTDPELHRPFKTPFSPVVPLLGIGVCLTMMASLDPSAWARLLIWLGIGLVIYLFYGRRNVVRK